MPNDLQKPTVNEFARVFWQDLGALLSGSLSVPFAFLAAYTSATYTRFIYGALAVAGLLLAIYRMWAKERRNALLIQNELENEIAKQGQPKVTVGLNGDDWGALFLCLMNYTDSPAVNLRADDIQCGSQVLRFVLPTQVVDGLQPKHSGLSPRRGR
jgi:hypothetical protein